MLKSLNEMRGYAIQTKDGHKGKVSDFYFDDWVWTIRYLVADTGNWLPGRLVLISPDAFEKSTGGTREFPLRLTKHQIERSPSIDVDKPVSRQIEIDLFNYYRWTPYWTDMDIGAASAAAAMGPAGGTAPKSGKRPSAVQEKPADPHLQSVQAVLGYRIQASDGEIGHIDDFIVDDEVWAIRYAVLDTRNWLPGKKILLASEWIMEMKWGESAAAIPFLTREQIKNSPPYVPSELNRDYETRFYGHYGRPGYWTGKGRQ